MTTVVDWIAERDELLGAYLRADPEDVGREYRAFVASSLASAFSRAMADLELDDDTRGYLLAAATNTDMVRQKMLEHILHKMCDTSQHILDVLEVESPGDARAILEAEGFSSLWGEEPEP